MSSGYDFEATDYPSLGANGAFSVEGGQLRTDGSRTYPNIKANIGGGGFLVFDSSGSGLTISREREDLRRSIWISTATTPRVHRCWIHVERAVTCS